MNNQLKVGTKVYKVIRDNDGISYTCATILSVENNKYIIQDEKGQIFEVSHVYTEDEFYNYVQDEIVSISLQIEQLRAERFRACQLLDAVDKPVQRKKH